MAGTSFVASRPTRVIGVPLDTHPFVLFYNTDICKKAGLLGADGNLKSMDGPDTFVQALTAAQKQGGAQYGGVVAITKMVFFS